MSQALGWTWGKEAGRGGKREGGHGPGKTGSTGWVAGLAGPVLGFPFFWFSLSFLFLFFFKPTQTIRIQIKFEFKP